MEISKDNEFVDTFEKIYGDQCRICLKRTVEVCELFENGDFIPQKLMAVASVQVEKGDGLPPVICSPCNRLLDASYEFKCQIQSTDEKLRRILKLKLSAEDRLNSTNIVEAILTDLISNVVSCEKDLNERQNIYPRNMPSNILPVQCFVKDEVSYQLDIVDSSMCEGNESEVPVINVQSQKPATCLNISENVLDSSCVERMCHIDTIKQETVCEAGDIGNQEGILQEPLKTEGRKISSEESCTFSEETSQVDGTQDDEEKPLICRTTRLRCAECIKSFRTKRALQRHAIVHNCKTKLLYVCYVCDKQYSTLPKLKKHVVICHEAHKRKAKEKLQNKRRNNVQEKRVTAPDKKIGRSMQKMQKNESTVKEDKKNLKLICKVCSKQFIYQKSFVTHALSHPEYQSEETDDFYRCSDKEKSAESVEEEEENEEGEDDDDEENSDLPAENLQCTQCGKLFSTKRNLKRHISTHSGLKYNCGICEKGFTRMDKLKDHEQSKHKEEIFEKSDAVYPEDMDNMNEENCIENRKKDRHNRPHKCTICPKSFAQAQSLANHMERHNRVKETQKRFLCEVCSKCFAQSGSLVAHMRTHTGVKPYVCNVCSRAFTKSTYLQLHLRTHSGEKPYICQYCSRAFARANTLARHITMHTGEAKYHCQICTKSFRRLTSLNEHTYTHTGQRPYACKICTKRYNNAGSLYAHRKKCKAQQLSTTSFVVSMENNGQPQDVTVPQVLIYSQRKLVEDATVGQPTPTPQYMIANVHNQKNLNSNIIQPFTVDDPNVYTINSKQFKNSYYTIYPNM